MTRTLEQLKTLKAEIIADLEHVEHLDEKLAIAFRRWQAGKKRGLEDIQAFLNALDKLAEEDR